MPGFNMGTTASGQTTGAKAEPRRKHRWEFTVDPGTKEIFIYLQRAARPKFTQDKVEMWHIQAPAYYSGRSQWAPISIAFYDIENDPDTSKEVWDWHQIVVAHKKNNSAVAGAVSVYKSAIGTLSMLKHDGTANETWKLYNCWPQTCDFSDLTYTSSEIQLITVELVFDLALRE